MAPHFEMTPLTSGLIDPGSSAASLRLNRIRIERIVTNRAVRQSSSWRRRSAAFASGAVHTDRKSMCEADAAVFEFCTPGQSPITSSGYRPSLPTKKGLSVLRPRRQAISSKTTYFDMKHAKTTCV